MSAGHDHTAGANERAMRIALGLTTTFLIVEVVGGIVTGSLALLSDAAHMFTDAAALAIALMAIRIGRRKADDRRTFGYYRFEILAAAFNAVLLFLVAIYILYEAYRRISNPESIGSVGMLLVAIAGLVINLISMRLLSSGKDTSLNVKGAYLEVWADMLGSVGVIVGAVVIYFTGLTWVDSVVAVAIGLWVLPRTWALLSESLNVLLEGVPHDIPIQDVRSALESHEGVVSIHDLHIWGLSSGRASFTVHVVRMPDSDPDKLVVDLRDLLADKFDIHHSTIQIELTPCELASGDHSYMAKHEDHDHAPGHSH